MSVLFQLLQVAGALGIFIYGMKIMSEGLQRVAGDKLRSVLRSMTSNRFFGILTGFLITVLIQSSSATTVMVVSFVNAGLLSLAESLGVIMGANIGTTVTLWLVAILGFKVKITPIAIALIGLFFPLLFSKNDRVKHTAEFILGFGILFIGLQFLKDAVPNINENPEAIAFVSKLTNFSFRYVSILIFIGLGTILTVVVQSSSASTAITLTLLAQGWIPFDLACAMVLGENIGTTITANIAAIVANVHAKRAARFHFLFNIIGVLWMLLLFIPYTKFIQNSMEGIFLFLTDVFGSGAYEKNSLLKDVNLMGMALFHTSFNLLNVLTLAGFVPFLAKLVIRFQPANSEDDEEFRLQFIGPNLVSTTSLALANAQKEIQNFAKLIDKMGHTMYAILFEKPSNESKLLKKIAQRETMTDTLELELNNYLAKVSESDLTSDESGQVQSMLSIANDLERMGDIYYVMSKNYERILKLDQVIPEEALQDLKEMMELTKEATKLLRKQIQEPGSVALQSTLEIEKEINKKRKKIFKKHFVRLEKGIYKSEVGVLFIDFVNRCERIGDHIINIHEAISNESDIKEEQTP